jgi:phospholipid N-methyltransferase
MNKNVYVRPNKPAQLEVKNRRSPERAASWSVPEVPTVDKMTECHVTPDWAAARMVEALSIKADSRILEPESGTGNLIAAILERFPAADILGIEKHMTLYNVLKKRFDVQKGVHIKNLCFLSYAQEEAGRFDRIIMNPPFRHVRQHIEAAKSLLSPTGVCVALVPVTFDDPEAELIETLPVDTFSSARVSTKIIRLDCAV